MVDIENIPVTMLDVQQLMQEDPTFATKLENVALRRTLRELVAVPEDEKPKSKAKAKAKKQGQAT